MRYAYVRQTCSVGHAGGVVHLKRGQVWDASHPLVKQRPDFFSDEPTVLHGKVERPVEDASAEPGQKRRTK